MKQLLEDRGFTVELKSGRSTEYLREGMEFGDGDKYPINAKMRKQ